MSRLLEKIKERLGNQPITKPTRPKVVKADPNKSLAEKFVDRMLGEAGVRPDLAVVDWKRLDRDTATVVLQYSPVVGPPSKEEVFAYFERAFGDQRVFPVLETARHYAEAGVYTMVVRRAVPRRPYDDTLTMRKVTASTFLDVELGTVWKVEEGEKGNKYLARVMEDDIDEVLAREVQKIKAPIRATVRDIYAAVAVNVGDKVKFYADGKDLNGEVTKVDEVTGTVTIKGEDGKSYDVAKEAVYYIVELGPKTKQDINNKLSDYYGTLWGEKVANEILKDK